MDGEGVYHQLGDSIELASQVMREAAEESRRRRMMSSAYELAIYAYELRALSGFVLRESGGRGDRTAAADEVLRVVSGSLRPAVVAALKALKVDGAEEAISAAQIITQAIGIDAAESCEADVQLGLDAFAAAKSGRLR